MGRSPACHLPGNTYHFIADVIISCGVVTCATFSALATISNSHMLLYSFHASKINTVNFVLIRSLAASWPWESVLLRAEVPVGLLRIRSIPMQGLSQLNAENIIRTSSDMEEGPHSGKPAEVPGRAQ